MYPRSDQFLCVRCKNRTFTSWNDFENHHAKHAVDSAIARLPLVKLVRLQLPPGAQSVLINSSDADNFTFSEISSNSTPSETSSAASDLVKYDKGPKASVSSASEELLTWPGSCESSSPVNSPVPTPSSSPATYTTPTTSPTPTNETIPTEKNISDTVALEPQVDSNVLDPAFIEKLGEEISFLNQNPAETAVGSTNIQEDSSYETLPGDIDTSGSSKSSVGVEGLPSCSFEELPSVIPLTPETPTTEKDEMPPETQIEKEVPTVDDPTVVEGTANVSCQSESPEKIELPKSKGQLRLVPFESLLSPSFQHVDDEEKEEAKSLQPSVISHSISKTHAMVAIPEQNLVELNIPTTHSTVAITHAHHQTITEAARHQRSHPSPPLETMGQNLQSSQRQTQPQQQHPLQQQPLQQQALQQQPLQQQPLQQQPLQQQPLQQQPQQQPQTRVYQFHSVASQGKQLVTSAATICQPHQQHLHQQQQNMQNQQLHHLQNQQQQHHLQNQQTQQQQNQQLQQQKQVQQQQLHQQMQQHQQYQQQMHQQSQQQQQALNNMQYQQQPYQQHVNLGVATGQQQQHPYTNQYMQQYSNQQRMQYQPPAYPASMRANPATELPRAGFTSATTFPNNANNCVIQTPSVTTAMYYQQTPAINQMNSSSSSYPLPNNTPYNSQTHLNNHSLPSYPSSIQHVRLQPPPVQTNRPQPTVSTVQPTVRQQAVNAQSLPAGPPQSALLHQLSLPGSSGVTTNQVRPQAGIQVQRPPFVAIRPQPPTNIGPRGSPIISQPTPVSQPAQNRMPTTTASSTASATSSTVIRAATSNNLGTPTTNATTNRVNTTTAQKRPAVVEGGISTSQPPQKIARTREEATAHVQQSGDCEVLIVQKKQAGLPVIQSVAGSSTSSAPKSTGQNVQTPSVASLMSNPNITVTPAKNKENSTSSEPVKAVTTASVVNSVTKSTRPITVDLTATRTADQANTTSSTQQQPSWKNPLTCQVCNETFSSQSLLKTHLVLHLKRTLQITARPTNSPPIARNTVAPASSTTNSRAITSGQTIAVVTPSSSGNGHSTYSSVSKRGPSATVRPITECEKASVNGNQQAKSGAAGPNNDTAGTSRTSSSPTATQSCGSKDTTPIADKSTNDDFFIPVVDLKRQDVLTRLESMGITLFIPASSLTATPDNSKFAIPILSSAALRRTGTTGFPNLCGVINVGNPQEIPSTKNNPI